MVYFCFAACFESKSTTTLTLYLYILERVEKMRLLKKKNLFLFANPDATQVPSLRLSGLF